MAFEREIETYNLHLMDLLVNEGKYVLVKGDQIEGPFDTYEQAIAAGYSRFGPVSFLMKKIFSVEPIEYFSRDLPLCQS
jgi:hypothetical protein